MGQWRLLNVFRTTAFAAGVLFLCAEIPAAYAQDYTRSKAELKHFDIAPQALADALEAFAAQSGLQFLLQASLVDGIQSNGVRGRLSDQDALAMLLQGTGLTSEFASADIIVINKPEARVSQAPPVKRETEFRDQLIVSARRRKEKLEDYPGIAAIFNESRLEAIQADGAEDIIQRVANAHIEVRPGSQMNVYIRGVGTETSGSGTRTDTGVGLYYDGVYTYLQGSRIPPVYYDLERVEVLKGPQGGLYGRNAIGGAIIAQPSSPENEFGAGLRVEAGNYDYINMGGHVNAPLSEAAGLRIAGFYSNQNSYYRNVFTGENEQGEETAAFRSRLKLVPAPDSQILLGYERTREDKGAQIVVPNEFGLNHVSVSDIGGFSDRDTDRWIAKSSWRMSPKWELRTVTGYTKLKASAAHDFNNIKFRSATSEFFVGEERRFLEAWQFSQDVLIVSASDGPFQWLAGAGFFLDNQKAGSFILSGFPSSGLADTESTTSSKTRTASAFVDFSYEMTPRLNVNASLRYSNEVRKGASSDSIIVSAQTGMPVEAPFQEFKADYGRFSPAVSLQYDLTPAVKAFAKITTGYQSGGVNTRAASSEATAFGPSTAINYETGIRGAWLNGKLQVNTAVFRMDQNDFHYRLDNPPFNEFVNEGRARTYGVDMEVIGKPFDWLDIAAAYGYLDAKVTSAPNASIVIDRGSRKGGSPLHTFVFDLNIERRLNFLENGVFLLNANYTTIRDRYIRDRTIPLENYDLINVKAGVLFNDSLEVYAYARNLTNDVNTITPSIAGSRLLSPPRVFGIGAAISR